MKISKNQLKTIITEAFQDAFVYQSMGDQNNYISGNEDGLFAAEEYVMGREPEPPRLPDDQEYMTGFKDGYEEGLIKSENEAERQTGMREQKEKTAMKITKQQLRRIIREERRKIMENCGGGPPVVEDQLSAPMGDPIGVSASERPCPHETADALKQSGASDAEILSWIKTLLSDILSEGDFSFTGDVIELPGDEAFGVGYEAGTRGL